MKLATSLAAALVAAVILSTSASYATSMINGPIIDVTPPIDNTPVDVPPPIDNTPVDVDPIDYTPVDVYSDPLDEINDAILDGVDDDKTDVADVSLILSCTVDGDDLIITNKGDPIPPGTKVKWVANGDHGTVKASERSRCRPEGQDRERGRR